MRVLFSAAITVVLVLAATAIASAQTFFEVTQLTDNDSSDWYPYISNDGEVVWMAHDGTDFEIFLFDGANTIQLTDNDTDDTNARINSQGTVVWNGDDGTGDDEIFLYDGTDTIQFTDNYYDDELPQINDNGDMIWSQPFDGSHRHLYLYDDATGETTTLATDADSVGGFGSQLNIHNDVVWVVAPTTLLTQEVFLYNAMTSKTTRLTDNNEADSGVVVTDSREVFWHTRDPDDSYNDVILRYDISTGITSPVVQITGSLTSLGLPHANGTGQLVLHADDDNGSEILMYDGTSVVQVTDNDTFDREPKINETGQVVWRAYGDALTRYDIWMYDGVEISCVVERAKNDGDYDMNDSGVIVWSGWDDDPDEEIFLAVPLLPEIEVSPLTYDFAEVEVETSSTVIATIANTGAVELAIASIDFGVGSSTDFSFSVDSELPLVVAPGANAPDVEITYAPSESGSSSAVLIIESNDRDEAVVEITLSGTGVVVEPPPSEQAEDILVFLDDSVDQGTLEGSGSGNSAGNRLNALNNMLETAGDLINDGMFVEACEQLHSVYLKTDGVVPPPDFVQGEAAAELAEMIQQLMTALECE